MGFNDEPMIKQKNYSEEEYNAKKIKSFGVAKRILIMRELMHIFIVNTFISLGMFILLVMGTSAIPYFFDFNIDFGPETFALRGGLFVKISIVFLVIFAIVAFWYAIGYKKLEIMNIRLDGKLYGEFEVNEAAQKDNLKNNLGKTVGLSHTSFSSISGPAWVANNYLNKNGFKTINTNIFKGLYVLLIIGQITLAFLCVGILIK